MITIKFYDKDLEDLGVNENTNYSNICDRSLHDQIKFIQNAIEKNINYYTILTNQITVILYISYLVRTKQIKCDDIIINSSWGVHEMDEDGEFLSHFCIDEWDYNFWFLFHEISDLNEFNIKENK